MPAGDLDLVLPSMMILGHLPCQRHLSGGMLPIRRGIAPSAVRHRPDPYLFAACANTMPTCGVGGINQRYALFDLAGRKCA